MLSADFLNLGADLDFVNREADIIHLDVMDGTFVPNISFGFPVVEAIAAKAEKPMDAHLMIVNPGKYIERFAKVGVDMLSFHFEAAGEESLSLIQRIHSYDVKAGIAINPDVPVEKIFHLLSEVDYVLIMSVFAGFGGQKFIPESLERIRRVKAELGHLGEEHVMIEVDGGVGPSNAAALREAGADILVAGSSVFKAPDRSAALHALKSC